MREAIAPVSTTRSHAAGSAPVAVLAHPGAERAGYRSGAGPGPSGRGRLAHGALIVMLLAVAGGLAWALRAIGDQPIVYDANGYQIHAEILAHGPIEVWGFRTYGYPAFLVPWVVLAGRDQELLKSLVWVAQLVVHLAAAWLFARRVAAALGDEALGRLTFVLVALNPFLLLMASPLLSDLLSTALIAGAIGLLLPTRDERPAVVLRDGMLALCAIAFAVEVRPANATLLPVCALLWTIRWWLAARPDLKRFVGGVALVGAVAALPLVPQSVINWWAHGNPTPLLVTSLYEQQLAWGVQNLKYVTFALPRNPGLTSVFYVSPFADGETTIAELAQSNPLGLVATLALHAFALFDQDYPFPYIREMDSWTRWPLAATGYLFLWAAVVGLGLGRRRWWRPGTRLAWGIPVLTSAAYVAVYLPTAVECRFGLPLFALLAPAVATTLLVVVGWLRERAWRPLVLSALTALVTVGSSAWISVWMQTLAPEIAATREIVRNPSAFLPVARYDAVPPIRWTVDQKQTYVFKATNMGDTTWSTKAPGQVFLRVRFVGPGAAETVDTRVEVRPPIDRDVPPGEQLAMDVTVSAPRKEGEYRVRQWLEIEEQPGSFTGPIFDAPVVVEERRGGRR